LLAILHSVRFLPYLWPPHLPGAYLVHVTHRPFKLRTRTTATRASCKGGSPAQLRSLAAAVMIASCASVSAADIVIAPYTVDGPNDTVAVAAAAFAGWYASADSFQDQIEIRDIRGNLRRTIARAEIALLAPWMNLDGGTDGPSALAFTASGRVLYILVHDDTTPGDGQPSDVLLRYDVSTNVLSRQARLELFNQGNTWPRLGAAHHKSLLYVGTGSGQIAVYVAGSASAGSSPVATWSLPGGGIVHGLTIDRDTGTLYASSGVAIFRAALPASPTATPTFTQLATGSEVRALAWGDHYGAASQRGLYILSGSGPANSKVDFIVAATAATGSGVVPAPYTTADTIWHDIAFTADGRLFVGADEDAAMLSDSGDARLGFDAWMRDELAEVTAMGRGLISPDGEPDGWVIDADVLPSWNWFHPATPDAAAWTVCLLMMNEAVNGDPQAQQDVARVLTRYAGLSPDGIKPARSADGIFKHWLNPATGNTEATWPDEYATLSTMKIVFAAARAMDRYPDDPAIVRAASRIIFLTRNWGAYIHPSSNAIAFKGIPGGGADTSSWSPPFNEGIIFAEQVNAYGGSAEAWFTRSLWPTATYLPGRPITVAAPGLFQPAFLSLYAALVSKPFRDDPSPTGWRAQLENVRWSSAAYTDDVGARYFTVFSAGTSPAGYNADTFTNHPGNITTFTSLLALAAYGETAEAVGGYAAYRKGARQTFKTGASILYRRPYDGGSFVPNSAGLPDVALGALALGEILQPGSVDAILSRPYPQREMCPIDVNGDGMIDIEDLYAAIIAPADRNGDGVTNAADWRCLLNWLRRHENTDITGP